MRLITAAVYYTSITLILSTSHELQRRISHSTKFRAK